MKKSPLDMEYDELNALLTMLLRHEQLPVTITYQGSKITYHRPQRFRILLKAVFRLAKVQLFYMQYMRHKINSLKKTGGIFQELKKTRCLKNQRTYLYLSTIGLTDLTRHLGGRFNNKLFAHFCIATMLYDASFDIPRCRKYLRDFDTMIMNHRRIESSDSYLSIFQASVDYLEQRLGASAFTRFMNLVQIEHISQLMSIYQIADKPPSKQDLMKITFAKGGISALALMYLMIPSMKTQEKKAIYALGGVLQIIDDISDIAEDAHIGIQTLPNLKLLTYDELKQLYYGTVNNLIDQCNMDPTQPNGTLDMLCWFADIILEKRYKSFAQAQKQIQ